MDRDAWRAPCDSWSRIESATTERLNWSELSFHVSAIWSKLHRSFLMWSLGDLLPPQLLLPPMGWRHLDLLNFIFINSAANRQDILPWAQSGPLLPNPTPQKNLLFFLPSLSCGLVANWCPTLALHGLQAAWLLSMEFSRQEYWSRLPFRSPGDLPDPGIESTSCKSAALAVRFFTTSATWETLLAGGILFNTKLYTSGVCLARWAF